MLSDSLRGKVAIVTGAASGIGAALAEHLVSKGWYVALCDVQDEKGRELATSLGNSVAYYHCDVASYDSQSAVFSSIWQKFGRIDALIANAAFSDRNALFQLRLRANGLPSIDDIPPSPDTTCTDVAYKGVIYGTQLAIHFMRHNPCDGKVKGRIICTSSLAGIEPEPAVPQYSGAKAGVIHFARATAPVLWEKDAITMNVVCPGLVTTPLAPKELLDASLPEHRTSMELVLRAFDDFIDRDDGERNGEVVAAHAAKITEVGKSYLRDTADGADESVRRVSKVLMRLVQGDE